MSKLTSFTVEVSSGPVLSAGKNFPAIPNVRAARYKKLHFRANIAACADSAPTIDNPAWTSPAPSPFAMSTAYDVVMHPGGLANLAAV
jgi:hypothetical protein